MAGTAAAQTGNRQRILPLDSEFYAALRSLYISRGLALPSTTGPQSEAELSLALDRLDTAALSPGETELYDHLASALGPRPLFTGRVTPALEAQAHTNGEDFSLSHQFYRPINTMRPFLGLSAEMFLTDNAYIYFEWPVTGRMYYADKGTAGSHPPSPGAGESFFSANIPFLAGENDFDSDTPYRAFLALGGGGWNVVLGRDRLSWGPGESGNFVVGDQVHYHNNLRASFFNDSFKYTYNITGFPYPGEYYLGWKNGDYDPSGTWSGTQTGGAGIKGLSLFIAHRGEMRFLKQRLNLVITETIRYQSRNGNISLEAFLPVLLMHNFYRDNNQNSLLSLEADYALFPGLNLYGQVAVDEFNIPFAEGSPSADAPANPPAMGYMLGAKTAFPLRGGIFQASLEGAYTTPYLYLDRESEGFNSNSFVTAVRYQTGAGYYFFVEDFLGYRWGGDALVVNLRSSFTRLERWKAQFNFLLMFHGTHDRWTKWEQVYSAGSGNSPRDAFLTSAHQPRNYADPEADRRNAVSVTILPSVSGSVVLWKNCRVYGEADFIAQINHGNRRGAFAADLQLSLGFSYSFDFSVPAETHALDG
jgi:hypothetical protein